GMAAATVDELLDRVRGLDRDAKSRLASMLDRELDLPYLDLIEREYARAFRLLVPERAVQLRGRFVAALNMQREQLRELVRRVLQESE
ncbi:MAG: hypothetical protein M1457_00720, partial [bacterium]|nr:hypothetical protein [bacterium]